MWCGVPCHFVWWVSRIQSLTPRRLAVRHGHNECYYCPNQELGSRANKGRLAVRDNSGGARPALKEQYWRSYIQFLNSDIANTGTGIADCDRVWTGCQYGPLSDEGNVVASCGNAYCVCRKSGTREEYSNPHFLRGDIGDSGIVGDMSLAAMNRDSYSCELWQPSWRVFSLETAPSSHFPVVVTDMIRKKYSNPHFLGVILVTAGLLATWVWLQ